MIGYCWFGTLVGSAPRCDTLDGMTDSGGDMTDSTVVDPGVSFMALLEQMGPLLDSVAGYRAQCESRGFSPTVAE